MRLHLRIFVLVLLMLVGLAATSIVFIYRSTQARVEAEVADSLLLAERTFTSAFEARKQDLATSVQAIVSDWALRQAIGQRDAATAEGALLNHSTRVGADLALFIDLDRRVFATTRTHSDDMAAQMQTLLDVELSQPVHHYTVVDGRHYQLVVAEVRAPVRMGWLAVGFVIDDALATRFADSLDVGVSFVAGAPPRPFASSFDAAVVSGAAVSQRFPTAEFWRATGHTRDDLLLFHELSGLSVMLQKSLSEPMASFRAWWWSLLTIFACIVLLALGVAYVFSRSLTKPLTELLRATRRMEAGDYSSAIDTDRRDEIGALSGAFVRMQHAIAEREEEIRYRATHETATGILNRTGFVDAIEAYAARKREEHESVAVLCLRANHFREIVDALGQTWADRLLKLIAERLTRAFPEQCVSHVNLDEFALVATFGHIRTPYAVAEAVHECLTSEFSLRGISLSLTVSVGISVFPEHGPDGESLLRRAGIALNEAVAGRQRTVVYDHALDHNSVRHLTLMSELPKAISAEQLAVYFQPKLRCTEQGPVVSGVECLVRWQHPDLGQVAPDEFIGLAEKTGYIVELTRYVLRRSIAQCAAWRRAGRELVVAVNISALDLRSAGFASMVDVLLDEHELPGSALCLEVTESAAMEDPQAAIEALTRLRELGVRLSIDDYGTGYSSLAQLKKLPVHELKIDKSFIQELDRNEDDQTIVRSTIELAHNVGLEVVAEGVESRRIIWQLDHWGCDYVQGTCIGEPMPLEAFERWALQPGLPARRHLESVVTSADRPARPNRT